MENALKSAFRSSTGQPPSTPSYHTLMLTPQSSNSSSTVVSSKMMDTEGGRLLLQERIKEKKAESARSKKASLVGELDVTSPTLKLLRDERNGTESSPSHSERDSKKGSDSSISTLNVGMVELQETLSKLHKQNFDLKLELFHRRERQSELEMRLADLEERMNDQHELQAVNEELLEQLQYRDQAIEEAVALICDLEGKVEKLEEEREIVRQFDIQEQKRREQQANERDSPEDRSKTPVPTQPTGQPRTTLTDPPRMILRMPSFLSEQSESTEALRGLYMPPQLRHEPSGLPSLSEELTSEVAPSTVSSPRLSLLSESSFISVYGKKNQDDELEEDELLLPDLAQPEESEGSKAKNDESVTRWMDEGDASSSPVPSFHSQDRSIRLTEEMPSINNVLMSPLQRLERLEKRLAHQHGSRRKEFERKLEIQHGKDSTYVKKSIDTKKASEYNMDSSQSSLPPTPDTISTHVLHNRKGNSRDTFNRSSLKTNNSQGTSSSHQEIPFLDEAAIADLQRRLFHTTRNTYNERPRTASETINSQRRGHGWDTETQSSISFTNTVSSRQEERPLALKALKHPEMMGSFPGEFLEENDQDDMWSRQSRYAPNDLQPVPFKSRNLSEEEDQTIAPRRLRSSRRQDVRYFDQSSVQEDTSRPITQRRLSMNERLTDRQRQVSQRSSSSVISTSSANLSRSQSTTSRPPRTEVNQPNYRKEPLIQQDTQSQPGHISALVPGQSYREQHSAKNGSVEPICSLHLQGSRIELEGGATPPPIARYPSNNGRKRSTSTDKNFTPMISGLRNITLRENNHRATNSSTTDGRYDNMLAKTPTAPINKGAGTASSTGSGKKWFGLSKNVKK